MRMWVPKAGTRGLQRRAGTQQASLMLWQAGAAHSQLVQCAALAGSLRADRHKGTKKEAPNGGTCG